MAAEAMSDASDERILMRADGTAIAYHRVPGKSPGVIFCGGFMSDMSGTKATALEAHCRRVGRACLRFDYRGHGRSSGAFVDGTVGLWAEDAVAVLDLTAPEPQILVGSSMGGWIVLLAALARPHRVAALVGVAAAPDFVLRMWDGLPDAAKRRLETEGVYRRPSQYADEPYAITMKLIEDGRRHLVMRRPIPFAGPVRLLHGMRDPDVPWQVSLDLAAALVSEDVAVTLVKDGDHRLSEPADIARLLATVEDLARQLEAR
jgi:pimeloyl-ACP methyl ester carboxylesterase